MLHQIGVGVLGPVFRAYDPSRDRPFVVKELRVDVTPEQARLLVEALESLAVDRSFHPAVVMPVAVGVEDGTPYLVQEHIGAESLDLAARRYARAEVGTTLSLLDGLATALDAAHGRGVLHGALHLRDIFVDADLPRVTGFGIVPALEKVGLRGPLRRPYAAPELVAGQAWGPAADRFALAVVAYELLTGRRPAGTGAQVGAQRGTDERLPDAEALDTVFAAALADEPKRRPASAGRFATELRAALAMQARRPAARPVDQVPSFENRLEADPPTLAESAGDSGIFNFNAGEPDDLTADDRDQAAGAPSVLPAATVAAADRPWWWPSAQVLLAVLLVVVAAAAYRAGLGRGGDSPPAGWESPVGQQPAPTAPAAPAAPAVAESAGAHRLAEPPSVPVPAAAPATPAPDPVAQVESVADAVPPATPPPALEAAAVAAQPAPAVEDGTGWVLVRTTPPGARVTLGGADQGVTPLSIGDLPFGSLEIGVQRDGYQPVIRQVVLSTAQPVAAVGIALSPLAAAASLDRGGAR